MGFKKKAAHQLVEGFILEIEKYAIPKWLERNGHSQDYHFVTKMFMFFLLCSRHAKVLLFYVAPFRTPMSNPIHSLCGAHILLCFLGDWGCMSSTGCMRWFVPGLL